MISISSLHYARAATGGAMMLALSGCQGTDHAVFVTDTRIGIGVDTATSTSHLGFDRLEAYIGPAYPETGAVPPVVASVQSDLRFLAPRVHQFYATGDAALIATRKKNTPDGDKKGSWKDAKGRRLAVVGTDTHFGLVIQAKDQNLAKFDFGYGRQEASLLPLRDGNEVGEDIYPSVIASIAVDTSANAQAIGGTDGLKLSQFIATGGAAEQLATRDDVRNSFGLLAESAAKDAATKAAKTLNLSQEDFDTLVAQGGKASQPQTDRANTVIMKLLGVAPADMDRALTQGDRDKIRTAAAKLGGNVDDTTTLAGRANHLGTAMKISDVRKGLTFDNDLLNELTKSLM